MDRIDGRQRNAQDTRPSLPPIDPKMSAV